LTQITYETVLVNPADLLKVGPGDSLVYEKWVALTPNAVSIFMTRYAERWSD